MRFGLERGELRSDLDIEMVVSILDWVVERFQDALLIEELDPGLVSAAGRSGGEERSTDRAVPGCVAKSDRDGTEET